MSAARWTMRAATAATTLILAYLLGPAEYGLVALAMVIASMIFVGNFGLSAAAVQRRGYTNRRVLDLAWTADKLIFNSVLAIAMFAGADSIASWFQAPDLAPIVQVLAAVPILRTIENNALIVFTRRLDYRSRFLLEFGESITTLVLVVILALLWQSVWAFIIAYVAGAAVRTVMSYVLYPRAPRPHMDPALALDMFRFGRWMVGLRLLELAREQLATLIVAAALGPTSLAFYHVGSRFSVQIISDVYQTGHKVLFPIYARIQNERERLSRGYAMILLFTLILTAPLAALSVAFAAPLLHLVLGPDWLPAAPVLQVLGIAGLLRVMVGTSHPLFRGKGRGDFEFIQNLAYLLVLLLGLAVLPRIHGVVGAAWAVLIAEAVQIPLWLWLIDRALQLNPLRVVRLLWIPLLAATMLWASSIGLLQVLATQRPITAVAVAITGGASTYLAFLIAGLRVQPWNRKSLLTELLDTVRRVKSRRGVDAGAPA